MCLLREKGEGPGHFFKSLLVPHIRKLISFFLVSVILVFQLGSSIACSPENRPRGEKAGILRAAESTDKETSQEKGTPKNGASGRGSEGSGTKEHPTAADQSSATDQSAVTDRPMEERGDQKWWYFDGKGRLISRRDPVNIPPSPFRPWTRQVRITGFCQTGEEVIAVVNTQGWYRITPSKKGGEKKGNTIPFPMWRLYREPGNFGEYTAGAPLVHKDKVVVHLYRDTVLSFTTEENPETSFEDDASQGTISRGTASRQTPGNTPSIVAIRPEEGEVFPLLLTPPFKESPQKKLLLHIGHCVDLLYQENEWISAWKKITPKEIVFQYRSLDPATGGVTRLSKEQYREAAHPHPLESIATPKLVSTLFEEWKQKQSPGMRKEDPVIYDITLHTSGPKGPYLFRYGDESLLLTGEGRIIKIPMLLRQEKGQAEEILGLFPDNTVHCISNTKKRVLPLPDPGRERKYTHLWATRTSLMIAWERVRFTETAEAGVLEIERP